MTRKKDIEIIEQPVVPTALVVGQGTTVGYICAVLEERGCKATFTESLSPIHTKYDYLVQFGEGEKLEETYNRFLKETGKCLYIATFSDENIQIEHRPNLRILYIGDLDQWEAKELAIKVLKTLFSSAAGYEKNVRRGSALKEKVHEEEKKQSIPQKPVSAPVPLTRKERNVKIPHIPLPSVPKITFTRRRISRPFLIVVGTLFISGAILAAVVTTYLQMISRTAVRFQTHINSSNWKLLPSDIAEAKKELGVADFVYKGIYTVAGPFRESRILNDLGELLNVSHNVLETAEDSLSFFSTFRVGNPFSPDATLSEADLTKAMSQVNAFKNTLTIFKKRLETTNLPYVSNDSVTPFLNSSLQKVDAATRILPLTQTLFYSPDTKTFLILFQNNMELRPTGGFIGSFGLLTVQKGKVLDFKIMDVYQADGQLKGHVEPPSAIRKHLSQPNYFLRDSNFDPDFAISASTASFFIEKELGTKVDGVIGINLFLIQDLLRLIGDVTVADFHDELVNADNFFFKAQFFAQQSFFPGSTQKKDFLTAVANTLGQRLAGDAVPVFDLFQVIQQALEEKNILLAFDSETAQNEAEQNAWGGRMTPVHCAGKDVAPDCYSDYLALVESNFGVNKVNYYVEKSTTIEKQIQKDGTIQTVVTVAYENKSTAGVFGGGTYVNYLRFFVPSGSKLLSVTLNGAAIAETEIDQEGYGNDKTSIGFLLRVAAANKGMIKISFQSPYVLTPGNNSYQFLFQKQAGEKTSPLVVSFKNDSQVSLVPENFKSMSSNPNELYYSTDTSVDRIFALSKK